MAILPSNDEPLRELALFAGAGGGILGGILLGWRTVCAVEFNAYAASVLAARQNDGCLEAFPIWDDVRTFDGTAWRGRVDVVSGGFPCQDISAAGKGAGIDGERSGLWREMARIIRDVQPRFVFVENSPALAIRGLGDVIGDLAEMGFDARWGVLGARCLGGPVERERMRIACANKEYGKTRVGDQPKRTKTIRDGRPGECPGFWLQAPPVSFGVEHGMDSYVDQGEAIGNGQVPCVAALAWRILTGQSDA
jgi:DNA (cytosine-5)-methyltransferase 1